MQVLQRTLEAVRQRLVGLSPANRLLIGSFAIIALMGLFIVGLYSGRTNLVPLAVSSEARARTVEYLTARSIPWKDRGGEIMVPVEQRHLLLAQLTENEIIGPDQIDFDALVRQDSPFLSKAQHDRRWLVATMNHLSRTISRMEGIERCDVVIDEPARLGGIGRAHVAPSASVNVIPRRGRPLSQDQVNAIAEMVAGAHAELTIEHVAVVDALAGRVHHAQGPDRRDAGRYLELQRSTTEVYQEKLAQALQFIPGVNVAVNVIVDHREIVEESHRVDDPKQGVTRESSRTIAQSNRTTAGEAGVRPNTGASIGSTGRGSSLDDERAETRMVPAFGGTDSRTRDPGGYALKVNASIGVPRSYFVRLYRDQQGAPDAEPAAPELQPLIDAEIERIRDHVEPLVDTGPKGGPVEGEVAVTMIPDYAPLAALPEAAAATAGIGSGLVSDSLIKYGSLGGLAVLSLATMFMMVRKASSRVHVPGANELLGGPPPLVEGPTLAGDAEPLDAPLDGFEIDEATLRRQQMVRQLNELANAAPQEAAMLLRRWLKPAG